MLGNGKVDYAQLLMERVAADDTLATLSGGFKGPSLNYRRIEGLERSRLFRHYIQRPLFRDVCARAYGASTPIATFRVMLLSKPPRSGANLGWHQDYWNNLNVHRS